MSPQALRSGLPPHRISVIPNAVDTAVFRPDVSRRQPGRITIIVLSRLVYRKGIDLLVEVIPAVCKRHPEVRHIVLPSSAVVCSSSAIKLLISKTRALIHNTDLDAVQQIEEGKHVCRSVTSLCRLR